MVKTDAADVRILRALQEDGRITNAQLAERVGMATTPCWRRVRRLEEEGAIRGYRADLDREALGFGVMAFILVQIDSHSEAEAVRFEQEVTDLPEVVACYAVAGGTDFMLQVVARDLNAYSDFAMRVVRRLPRIRAMTTNLVLKEIKPFAGLPVEPR